MLNPQKKRAKVNELRQQGKSYRQIQKEMGFKSLRSVQQYLQPLKLMGYDKRALELWDYLGRKLESKTAKEVWNRAMNIFEK